ncbi:hypothetical protein D3C76_1076680 [compost metagenome]
MQAVERIAVRRQDQYVIGNPFAQSRQCAQPLADRVGIGFEGIYRDVRGDPRQYLITRDEQLPGRVVEAGVLRRVTGADDHLPGVVADLQAFAIAYPPIAFGQS